MIDRYLVTKLKQVSKSVRSVFAFVIRTVASSVFMFIDILKETSCDDRYESSYGASFLMSH